MKTLIKTLLIVELFLKILAVEEYLLIVPNGQQVVVDGVGVYGLGHADLTIQFATFGTANPFGQAVSTASRSTGSNEAAWLSICDDDSDGDGISNGEELCDPTCTNAGRDVDCEGDAVLTHPGFAEGVEIAAADIPIQVKIHGALMTFAWAILAPFGVARAVYYKKRGGKPLWFRDHRIALSLTAILTFIAFGIIVQFQGIDTIKTSFAAIPKHEVGGLTNRVHVILGTIVLGFALVQPLSGFFRAHLPKNGEKKSCLRLTWEFQHQWTGRAALLIAVAAIVSGIRTVFPGDGDVAAMLIAAILGAFGAVSIVYVMFFRDAHVKQDSLWRNSLEPIIQGSFKVTRLGRLDSTRNQFVDDDEEVGGAKPRSAILSFMGQGRASIPEPRGSFFSKSAKITGKNTDDPPKKLEAVRVSVPLSLLKTPEDEETKKQAMVKRRLMPSVLSSNGGSSESEESESDEESAKEKEKDEKDKDDGKSFVPASPGPNTVMRRVDFLLRPSTRFRRDFRKRNGESMKF